MKKLLFFSTLLLSLFANAQHIDDKYLAAAAEHKKGNYQKVIDLLQNENYRQNLDGFYLMLQAHYALITTDYQTDIAHFNFNRLVELRTMIDDYLKVAQNPKGIKTVQQQQKELLNYPTTEATFNEIRSQLVGKSQLQDIKIALSKLKFDKVIALVDEYATDGYVPDYELAYHKAIAEFRKVKLHRKTTTKEQKEQVLQELKNYRDTYQRKNILYDQAIKDAIRKL